MAFTLPELTYPLDALEPTIDATTMQIHHDKHHGGYVTNVNKAIEGTEFDNLSIVELLQSLSKVPAEKQAAVRNNAGGHFNHSLFWEILTPGGASAPSGDLAAAIDASFGSFDEFKAKFEAAAAARFGSGWAWLVVAGDKLAIVTTPNQDNPVMDGKTPFFGVDVWEHAYYLTYQNKRPEYLKAIWNVINWDVVAEKYAAAK